MGSLPQGHRQTMSGLLTAMRYQTAEVPAESPAVNHTRWFWLQLILTNLLANAVKYSAPGTPLDVRASPVIARGSSISPLTEEPEPLRQMVEIGIHDYGLGIPLGSCRYCFIGLCACRATWLPTS